MSSPTDPRIATSYKTKRLDEKQLLLLGAILDALIALKPKAAEPAASAAPAAEPAKKPRGRE